MTPQELKQQLTAIRAADFSADSADVPALTEAMLAHIGDPDPELRDDLIYATIARWSEHAWDDATKRALTLRLLGDAHLFHAVGEQESESVFTRSFSILALAILLYRQRDTPFLSADEVRALLDQTLAYAAAERDLRGHTGASGWAHSVAHLADLLDELALCGEVGEEELRRILETIGALVTNGAAHLAHEEDERLAYATLTLFERGLLPDNDLGAWLTALPAGLSPRQPFTVEGYRQRVNLKNYLRSLYFQSVQRERAPALRPAISDAERRVTLFA